MGDTDEDGDVCTAVAQAFLEVSYGMTELGAQRLLADARGGGSAETAAARVTLTNRYPESFTIEEI